MSFVNLFLGDQTVRELLEKIDILSKSSNFTKQAAGILVEVNLRKAFELPSSETPVQSLDVLCKAELNNQLPNLTDEELDEMSKARFSAIQDLSGQLVFRLKAIGDAFMKKFEEKTVAEFEKVLAEKFSDERIDAMIEVKISKLPVDYQKAILDKLDLNGSVRKSDLESFLQRHKPRGGAI